MTDSKDFIDLLDRVVATLTKKEIEETATALELENLISGKFFRGLGESGGNFITKTGAKISELLASEISGLSEFISDADKGNVVLVPKIRPIRDEQGFYDNFKVVYERETPKSAQIAELAEINRQNEEYAGELSRMNLDQLNAWKETKRILRKKGYKLSDKLVKSYSLDEKGRVRIMWKSEPKIVGTRVTAVSYKSWTPKQLRAFANRLGPKKKKA